MPGRHHATIHAITRQTRDVTTAGGRCGTTPRNKTKSKVRRTQHKLNNEQAAISLFPLFLLVFSVGWATKIERLRELRRGKRPQAAGSDCAIRRVAWLEDVHLCTFRVSGEPPLHVRPRLNGSFTKLFLIYIKSTMEPKNYSTIRSILKKE
jgi:hypothetical protein